MQNRNLLLTIALAAINTSPTQATVLLSDNFTGQSGSLAPLGYTTVGLVTNNGSSVVFSPVSTIVSGAYAAASPDHNFALQANAENSPLLISVDMSLITFNTQDWACVNVGGLQNGFVADPETDVGVLFRGNGGAEVFTSDTRQGLAGYTGGPFSMLLTDSLGTGSAFNGHGSVVTIMAGTTTIFSGALGTQLAANEGYVTLGAWEQLGGTTTATFDNLLIVTTAPEPSTALLGGLGLLGLLRRRRR